jgi:hypothetical protein
VIVTVVFAVTPTVLTVKVADDEPAGTVTLAGVVALALLSDRDTTMPPTGARPVKFTVPVEEVPPVTVAGLIDTELRAAGLMVRFAVAVPLPVAVMVAVAAELTALVVTVKLAVFDPDATVTLAGTVAAALLLDRLTTNPPVGALFRIVTVPVEVLPPTTDVGRSVTPVTGGGLIVSVVVCDPL